MRYRSNTFSLVVASIGEHGVEYDWSNIAFDGDDLVVAVAARHINVPSPYSLSEETALVYLFGYANIFSLTRSACRLHLNELCQAKAETFLISRHITSGNIMAGNNHLYIIIIYYLVMADWGM